jgi:DNA helicase-2/ATP-dependent DNA helicase PcrA
MWKEYSKMKVSSKPEVQTLPRLSLTGDIVAHRRCPRQYGFFAIKGFVPAHTVQIFYGIIIHEVLDRTHHHYQGFEKPETKGKIPTDEDIRKYFAEVEGALKAKGVRAINQRLRDQALEVLKLFNRVEGPTLYPLVVDTEHRVRGTREETGYIMEGVVDVLLESNSDPEKSSNNPAHLEIWDYKGQKKPKAKADLQSYIYQMQVYSALYKIRNKCLPKAAKLYFLNELHSGDAKRPANAILDIPISKEEIDKALYEFDTTAKEIMTNREKEKWDPPSKRKAKDIQDTCTICDLRWSCKAWTPNKFPMQYP